MERHNMVRTIRERLAQSHGKMAEKMRPKQPAQLFADIISEQPALESLQELGDTISADIAHDIVRLLTDSHDDYMTYADYDRVRDLYMYASYE